MNLSEILNLTMSAIIPFLSNVGQGALDSIGADLWKVLKKPFEKKNTALSKKIEKNENLNKENIKGIEKTIKAILSENDRVREAIEEKLHEGKTITIIKQFGQKSISIGTNSGNINIR